MSTLVGLLRALIRDELQALRLGDLAVVTAVEPHTDGGDAHNYECSVRLRDQDMELPRVPMCTPHVGQASAPQVGELVLLSYLGGDPNRPIVVGRLYSDQHRPPTHEAGAWHMESPLGGKSAITLAADGAVHLTAGSTTLSLLQDGDVEIQSDAALSVKVQGDATIECANCTVQGTASVKVDAPQITLGGGVVEIG